jgi:hypothetical protein
VPEPEPGSEAPEPASPEPDSEDTSPTRPDPNTNIHSQSEEDTAEDDKNNDDYLTTTQTSVDNGDDDARDYGEERGGESESEDDEIDESEEGEGDRDNPAPDAATTVEPDSDTEDGNGNDDDADDVLDTFPTEEGADRPDYSTTPTDDMLNILYGDHPHDNDGSHLDGGVELMRDGSDIGEGWLVPKQYGTGYRREE